MDSKGRLFILSDLHIWGAQDPVYRGLISFLREELQPGDTLILAGDVFDIFVGTKTVFLFKYRELFKLMESQVVEKGIRFLYLEGNHDFLLEGLLDHCDGFQIFSGDVEIRYKTKRIFLAHGDKVNPKDFKYKLFYALTRNPVSSLLVKGVPGEWVDFVGSNLSKASRRINPQVSEQTIQMFRNFACDRITEGYDTVILGHSHHLEDFRFVCGEKKGQYINCGFPRRDKTFFVWSDDHDGFLPGDFGSYLCPVSPRLGS